MKELTITSSVMIAAIIILRRLFRGKVSQRLIYAAWLLAAIRLLVPIQFGSFDFSIQNQAEPVNQIIDAVSKVPISGPSREELYEDIIHEYIDHGIPIFTPDIQQQIEHELSSSPEKPPVDIYNHYLQNSHQWLLPEIQVQIEKTVDDSVHSLTVGQTVSIIWLAGMTGMAVWFTVVNISFGRRLRRSAVQIQYPHASVPVWVSSMIASPCLFGIFRPSIYLTPQCSGNEVQCRHILTHELTHLKHKDHLWSLVRCICLCVYWFNPLVWLAAYLSKRDCELACDEAALETLGEKERIAYGKTLVDMVAASPSPVQLLETATSMHETKRQLKTRINYIINQHKRLLIAAVSLILVAALVTGCVFAGPKSTGTATDPTFSAPTVTDPPPTTVPDKDYLYAVPPPQQISSGTATIPDTHKLFSEPGSWLNMALTSLYTRYSEIDLKAYFNNGFPEESKKPTAQEWAQLSHYPGFTQNGTLIRLPLEKMAEVLEANLNFSPNQYSNDTKPLYDTISEHFDLNGMVYLPSTECLYFMASAPQTVTNIRVLSTERIGGNAYCAFYEADVPFSSDRGLYAVYYVYNGSVYRVKANAVAKQAMNMIPEIPDPGSSAQLPASPVLEDLVYTNYSLSVQWGNDRQSSLSIRLPAVLSFSDAANTVNASIRKTFGGLLCNMRDSYYTLNSYSASYNYIIDYEAYLSENILSIVITRAEMSSSTGEYDTPTYYVYTIDITTGNFISKAELIRQIHNCSYAQFLMHCAKAIPKYISDYRSQLPANTYSQSDETTIGVYVEDGKLMMIGHIIGDHQLIRTSFDTLTQYGPMVSSEAAYHSLLKRYPEMDDPDSAYSDYLRNIFYAEPELFVSMLSQESQDLIQTNAMRLAEKYSYDTYAYYLYYLLDRSNDPAVIDLTRRMLVIAAEALSKR